MTADSFATLETSIGHQFADRNILHEALSHSSHIDSQQSYERLEFLGDRVLGLLLADHFYAAFPQDNEGALSLRLHGEARMSTLATVAKNLKLADYIKSQSGLDIAVGKLMAYRYFKLCKRVSSHQIMPSPKRP